MKKWGVKEKIIEYLSFSVKERWAVLVLVLLIVVLFIIPHYFTGPSTEIVLEDSLITKAMADFDTTVLSYPTTRYVAAKRKSTSHTGGERFFFDPNTIGLEEWVKLGARAKTAQTIQKYREKGGQFRSAKDLEKIYGLPPTLIAQLKPYVRIQRKDSPLLVKPIFARRKIPGKILINQADSLAWETLPGIGTKLAGRIINYRNRLGGFYIVGQVKEVYGLQDSVFRNIEPFLQFDEQPLQLISINSATMEELSTHPYIRRSIATAIVQYRTMHGRFRQVEDLTKIHLIGPEQYAKIRRYCKID
nr:helix-hairpin-helix domain-containing protein [Flavihumibacter fluvii]